jgi:hypothetical protein
MRVAASRQVKPPSNGFGWRSVTSSAIDPFALVYPERFNVGIWETLPRLARKNRAHTRLSL